MIFCRFQLDQKTSFGILEGNNVTEVWGNPLEDYAVTNHSYPLDQADRGRYGLNLGINP